MALGNARLTRRICVYGLWHLGSVFAACAAEQGQTVVGLDLDAQRVKGLRAAQPPVTEPGLAELIRTELNSRRLSFTTDPGAALADADTLWVTFDTPVDDNDQADVAWVRVQLEKVRPYVRPGTLVMVSSQVPVGFSADLERDWRQTDSTLRFANSPENLRLGQALAAYRTPQRIIVGEGQDLDRHAVRALFAPLDERIEWMSLKSAEMTKHALNAFLAMSVAYTNEVARICEQVGADATEVERGLRTEPRIGARAYVTAGAPIAGGTLARDVTYLAELAHTHGLDTPMMHGILESNQLHMSWIRDRLTELLADVDSPRVALLGLTYKAGTDTLRRSAALDLAHWLKARGAEVRAFDPAIHVLPASDMAVTLANGIDDALRNADVAVLATPWPEFSELDGDRLVRMMRRPRFVDQVGFAPHLAADPRIQYVRVGRPRASLAVT